MPLAATMRIMSPSSTARCRRPPVAARLALLAMLLGVASLATEARAGAWMRSEGELQLRLDLSLSSADERWDGERRRVDAGCTTQRQGLELQAEYGYTYYTTLFAEAGLRQRRCAGEAAAANSGLDRLRLGMRGRLDRFRNGRSWELALNLPVAAESSDPARPAGGRIGITGGLHLRRTPDPYAGGAVEGAAGIVSTGFGVDLWSGGLAQQIWGYGAWDSRQTDAGWAWSTRVDATRSFGGDADLRANDYDKLTWSVELNRSIDRETRLSLGLAHDLWGRHVERATRLKLGLSRTWR